MSKYWLILMHTLSGTSRFPKQLQAFRMVPQGRSSILLRQKEEKELELGGRWSISSVENGRTHCKCALSLSSVSHPKHPGWVECSHSL